MLLSIDFYFFLHLVFITQHKILYILCCVINLSVSVSSESHLPTFGRLSVAAESHLATFGLLWVSAESHLVTFGLLSVSAETEISLSVGL